MDDYKTLVVRANLGNFDKQIVDEEQSVKCDYITYTDDNFPPRFNSMTPRLQARIPKMFAWQMKPGYDYYLWVDCSCRLPLKDSVKWFIDQLGDADMAVFEHPHRKTVGEEADYLKERLQLEKDRKKQLYILPRYENERLDEQMAVVDPTAQLYATTAFIYRPTTQAKDCLTLWWLHTSLYHSIDQLSLPKAISDSGAKVNVIYENYEKVPALEFVRNK